MQHKPTTHHELSNLCQRGGSTSNDRLAAYHPQAPPFAMDTENLPIQTEDLIGESNAR